MSIIIIWNKKDGQIFSKINPHNNNIEISSINI